MRPTSTLVPHRLAAGTALLALICAAAAPVAHAAEPASSSSGFSAGVSVQPLASAADVGLPAYPGAVPLREGRDDSNGATLALWGGSFGFQLNALKLITPDSVDDVARYYRDALSRQGRWLDCSAGAATDEGDVPRREGEKLQRCGKDRAAAGGRLYKLPMPSGVRLVTIEPSTDAAHPGTRVSLVRVQIRGD